VLLTQYLQFVLGYSPLAAGLRIAPIAAVLLVMAPAAAAAVKKVGTKVMVTAGLATVAAGLMLLSTVGVHTGYERVLVAMLVTGAGMGMTMSPAVESVMGSLPRAEAGVGSATNSTTMQVGGAVGVAVLGSVASSHYRSSISAAITGRHIPAPAAHAIRSSIGGALGVASHVGGGAGAALALAAREGYVRAMSMALPVAAGVAVAGALIALAFLPARPAAQAPAASGRPPGAAG
ncbi:MAG: MFS transporter, partial [Acidimicrobiales bacterium]